MTGLADNTCILGAVERGRLGQGFLSGTSLCWLFGRLHRARQNCAPPTCLCLAGWKTRADFELRAACPKLSKQQQASRSTPTARVAESCMHARACSRTSLLAKKASCSWHRRASCLSFTHRYSEPRRPVEHLIPAWLAETVQRRSLYATVTATATSTATATRALQTASA